VNQIHIWGFFFGLGLFLFGMMMLEQGLKGFAGKPLKHFLRQRTRSPVRGVVMGTFATMLLQSSSLVGLITLAFVGAGILRLRNALGIIFGSNLGTTMTGWIVTAIGFKLELGIFAEPIIAFGALGTVFLKKETRFYFYSNFILGLGLLLLGLGEMKSGFGSLAEHFDVSMFSGHHPVIYLLAGAAFTAIIQSSSATMMILLSALNVGIIDLFAAAALLIGADLGTTSTVLLGALKGSAEKRRVALSHFMFNLVIDIIAFIFIPLYLSFIANTIKVDDPLYALVTFHSLFNLVGIVIFIPFIDYFIRFLKWAISERTDALTKFCKYIYSVPPEITDAAIQVVRKELREMLDLVLSINLFVFDIDKTGDFLKLQDSSGVSKVQYEQSYHILKEKEGELLRYTNSVQRNSRDDDEINEVNQINHAIRNAMYAAKHIKDIRQDVMLFSHSGNPTLKRWQDKLRGQICSLYGNMISRTDGRRASTDDISRTGDKTREIYDELIEEVYTSAGKETLNNIEISTMLNLNRAVYLSNCALREVDRELLEVVKSDEI